MYRAGKRQALTLTVGLSAALLVAAGATADPSVSSKQAQARSVLGQIQRIDGSLERAVESYNLANVKLAGIERDQRENRRELRVARSSLRNAQAMLAQRLVTIYTSQQASTLEVLLGSRSLDDLINRLDAVSRVSSQDSEVIAQVTLARAEIARRKAALASAHTQQVQIVRQRAAERASIERQLAQRRALLSSIRGEIAKLQAAERARQLALARQVQARQALPQPVEASGAAGVSGGGQPSDATGLTSAPPQTHGGAVGIAMQYLGRPYVWGGASPAGFDCSGFVMYVFGQVGVALPHSSYAQWGAGVPVSRDQLQPGDLVFFDGLGHVGIYVGGNAFIHAPHSGDVVKISTISGWYAATYVGARRV